MLALTIDKVKTPFETTHCGQAKCVGLLADLEFWTSGSLSEREFGKKHSSSWERISCTRDVRAHMSTLNRECFFLIQGLVLFIHLSPPTSTMSVPGQQPDRWIKKKHSRFKVLT
jgi:hypothetical protein